MKSKKQRIIDLILNENVGIFLLVLFVIYFIASLLGVIPAFWAYQSTAFPAP